MTEATQDKTAERLGHLREIRALLSQLNSNASPSGAQTISKQIGEHINELENDFSGETAKSDGRSNA